MERYSRIRTSLDAFNGYPFDSCSISASTERSRSICPEVEFVETKEEKKERKRSYWVICIALFLWSIALTLPAAGIFPYLKLLEDDPQLSKTKLGWVVAVNPLGIMIFSPLLGLISNKLGSIRNVSYVSMLVFILANLLYGALPYCTDWWNDSAYHLMILARLLVGCSTGLTSVCRAYLATSTTLDERTTVLANQSASRSFGFIIGSVLQIALMLAISNDQLQYQVTGYVPAVMSIFVLILFTPLFFKEVDISRMTKRALQGKCTEERQMVPKPDYLALAGIMVCSFAVQFTYVLLETILTPFVQDQYGWCDEMAVVIVGLLFAVTGAIFMVGFIASAKLAKKYDERKILLTLSCGATLVGLVLYYPFVGPILSYCEADDVVGGTDTTPLMSSLNAVAPISMILPFEMYNEDETDDEKGEIFNRLCSNVTDCLGCPPEQEWCLDIPQLPFPQFIIAFCIILSSFPFGISMVTTLMTKILGPNPQGLWMGLLTAAGSFARITGPVVVSYLYSEYGTRYMDIALFAIMAVATVVTLCLYKRLVPMKIDNVHSDVYSHHSKRY